MQKYEESSKLSRKQIIINNFLGGISWALGGTIGLTVIISVLTLIAKHANLVPVIGNFVADIARFVALRNGTTFSR